MIHSLFATKIYKKNFPGDLRKFQEDIIPQLDKIFEESAHHNQASMRNGGICSFNVHDSIHHQIDMKEITDFVEASATEYWNELGLIKSKILVNHAWANIYPPGSYIENHNHIPATVVASFYLRKPANSGNMIFENPMSAILRYQPYNGLHDKDDYVSAFDTTIEVDEGDLVLFPGYLMHKTEKNMSNENRIILGFNIRHEFVL